MKKQILVLLVKRSVSSCICTFCICLVHQKLSKVQQYAWSVNETDNLIKENFPWEQQLLKQLHVNAIQDFVFPLDSYEEYRLPFPGALPAHRSVGPGLLNFRLITLPLVINYALLGWVKNLKRSKCWWGQYILAMRAVFRICGIESQPGLQLVE